MDYPQGTVVSIESGNVSPDPISEPAGGQLVPSDGLPTTCCDSRTPARVANRSGPGMSPRHG